jgi:ABC-type phosphate transport system substrate-binding protein
VYESQKLSATNANRLFAGKRFFAGTTTVTTQLLPPFAHIHNKNLLAWLTMKFSAIAVFLAALSPAAHVQGQSLIGLHGSGTTNPSKCFWHIMDQFQDRVKEPVKMTYRAVGSSTGQLEFIGDGTTSDNHFGAGDIPFDAEKFSNFPEGSVVQFPFVLGAISFFHSVPVENGALELNSCLLAKIFNLDITDWTDPEILELNPGLSLPSPYPIHVARRVNGSSSTKSITQYLHATCSDEWPANLVGSKIDWNSDTDKCEGSGGMTKCIRDTPGTIGYIDSGHGHSEGLVEIALRNADNVYISSKESSERGGIMAAVDNAGLPSDLTGSFADVNLLNQVSHQWNTTD